MNSNGLMLKKKKSPVKIAIIASVVFLISLVTLSVVVASQDNNSSDISNVTPGSDTAEPTVGNRVETEQLNVSDFLSGVETTYDNSTSSFQFDYSEANKYLSNGQSRLNYGSYSYKNGNDTWTINCSEYTSSCTAYSASGASATSYCSNYTSSCSTYGSDGSSSNTYCSEYTSSCSTYDSNGGYSTTYCSKYTASCSTY